MSSYGQDVSAKWILDWQIITYYTTKYNAEHIFSRSLGVKRLGQVYIQFQYMLGCTDVETRLGIFAFQFMDKQAAKQTQKRLKGTVFQRLSDYYRLI